MYKHSERKNLNVAAFVSSLYGTHPDGYTCTKYYSKCIMQSRDDNYINQLQMLMHGNLNK